MRFISLDQRFTESRTRLDHGRSKIEETLNLSFRPADAQAGKLDLNNIGSARLEAALASLPNLSAALQKTGQTSLSSPAALSRVLTEYRDRHSGLIKSFDELKTAGISEEVLNVIHEKFYLGEFAIIKTEIVGPKVGEALRKQAVSATLYALGGMLIYIAWRFKGTAYGAAAVLAVFHDVIITLGFSRSSIKRFR